MKEEHPGMLQRIMVIKQQVLHLWDAARGQTTFLPPPKPINSSSDLNCQPVGRRSPGDPHLLLTVGTGSWDCNQQKCLSLSASDSLMWTFWFAKKQLSFDLFLSIPLWGLMSREVDSPDICHCNGYRSTAGVNIILAVHSGNFFKPPVCLGDTCASSYIILSPSLSLFKARLNQISGDNVKTQSVAVLQPRRSKNFKR